MFTVRGRPNDKLSITIAFDSSAGVPYFTGITDKVYNNERTQYITESNGGVLVESDTTTIIVELTVLSQVLEN